MVSLLRRMRHDLPIICRLLAVMLIWVGEERLANYIRSIITELNQERIIFEAVEAEQHYIYMNSF